MRGRVVQLQELHEVQVDVHADDQLVLRKRAACGRAAMRHGIMGPARSCRAQKVQLWTSPRVKTSGPAHTCCDTNTGAARAKHADVQSGTTANSSVRWLGVRTCRAEDRGCSGQRLVLQSVAKAP